MRRTWFLCTLAAVGLVLGGCGREPVATQPGKPPGLPTGPAAAENFVRVAARIEQSGTVAGFPKTLVVTLVPDAGQGLKWNNDELAKPPEITLEAPAGVRLSQTSAVLPPQAPAKNDAAPRSARFGLAEDASAGTSWRLRVQVAAFVCTLDAKVCYPPLNETHVVEPVRGP